jgi:NAD-dependent SIR2 family protein deacetylase
MSDSHHSSTLLDPQLLAKAATAIREADALLIGAGAGMGVDSGLPDFRGDKGFWKAYPPMAKLGLSFSSMANPRWFERKPRLAWGFYGHRLHLYRDTIPHQGFSILLKWSQQMAQGAFVFTSNIDGQFQKAGFSPQQVHERHGSIHHLQCIYHCTDDIWDATGVDVNVNESTFLADKPLPTCRHCSHLSRPNILMFGDVTWLHERSTEQETRYEAWKHRCQGKRVVAIECGAGTVIPSVRWEMEEFVDFYKGTLIRINPREAQGPNGTLSFATGALDTLQAIDSLL